MRRSHLLGLVFIAIALGAIIGTVYNADTYAVFAEARANPGREFHIIGELVKTRPVKEEVRDNTLTLTFTMRDGDNEEAEVLFFGGKPRDFEQSDEVVLIGKYEGDRFVASSLLLKCPSKYNPGGIDDREGPQEYEFD